MLRQIYLGLSLTLLWPVITSAAVSTADVVAMPLAAADPQRPIEVLQDETWGEQSLQVTPGQAAQIKLKWFKFEAAKGPVQLVVDYAALRPNDQDGDSLFEVGVECPEASPPCPVPANTVFMSIKSDYMVPQTATIGGQAMPVWVGREIFGYIFEDQTTVAIDLSALEHRNLVPKAVRLRLVYGGIDTRPLPGQKTRMGQVRTVMFVVGAIVLGVFLWLRR